MTESESNETPLQLATHILDNYRIDGLDGGSAVLRGCLSGKEFS